MSGREQQHSVVITAVVRGGSIINRPDFAVKLAEVIVAEVWGKDMLAMQKPLVAADDGDRWVVRGSIESEGRAGEHGRVKVVLKKFDGQIMDLFLPHFYEGAPEVEDIVREHYKKNPPDV
ncbi:MAG: NTF2 fold immunity protein [Magnetospirillum sp.]|nr:NTF2 fold immunity protein [Magnetospirillum sp.]